MDSLSIFNFIDSYLYLEPEITSEFNFHFGFTSSVTSGGRDYDIDQRGFSPGVSYYHKSGLFADLTGFWNSDTQPQYNPTVSTFGYLGTVKKRLSFGLDYERWFFSKKDTLENPLTNSLSGSITYDFKFLELRTEYSFLFGKDVAHRAIGTLGRSFNLGKWWILDRISTYPSGSLMLGSGDVTSLRITENTLNQRLSSSLIEVQSFENFNQNQRIYMRALLWSAFGNNIITGAERRNLLQKLRSSEMLSREDQMVINKIARGSFASSEIVTSNEFGIINYSFNLPLMLSIKDFSIILSYTYSIPVALPGEFFEVSPLGFFGASLSYRLSSSK